MFVLLTVAIELCVIVKSEDLTYPVIQIPTISISSYVSAIDSNDTDSQSHIASLFDDAFRQFGVARIVDHKINAALMQNTLNGFKQFFHQNEDYKSQFAVPPHAIWPSGGFVRHGTENFANYQQVSHDKDLKDDTADVAEPVASFHIFSNWQDTVAMQGGNPYLPNSDNSPKEFAAYIPKYFSLMRQTVKDIHLIASQALGYDYNIFEEKMMKSQGFLNHRANCYYELPDDSAGTYELEKGYYWRFRAHRDFASFTFVHADNVQGFQIKVNDKWYSVPQIENSLFVISGDFIRFWTNGYWQTVLHRVVTKTKEERMAIASFSSTDLDEIIDILPECMKCKQNGERKFDAVLGAEWMRKRSQELWLDSDFFDPGSNIEKKNECK